MSDLGTRLSEGLSATAGRAPHPTDLAAGARARLRRRRRTTTAVVAAGLAVVAIPVGVAVVGGSAEDGPDDDESTVTEPPAGWRTETWRDLSVRVPPEWGYGSGRGWCAHGRELGDARQVSRPAGVVPAIVCTPSYGYGVHFQRPSVGELPPGTEGAVQQYRGVRYPDRSWIGYASTQQAAVWVVADDRTTARLVLDSATPVGEADAHGCATRLEMAAPSTSDRMSVCRYSPDGWLAQSELLSAADSRTAGAAVRSAPRDDRPDLLCGDTTTETVRLVGDDLDATIVLGCEAVLRSDGKRRLTEEVLHWALSPGWSGAVSRDVPLPDRLRGQ